MRPWSSPILPPERRITVYLDTNILMYLYNHEMQGVVSAINFLNSIPEFLDLRTSRYALFEFLDNRKKSHYKEYLERNGIQMQFEDGDELQSKYKSFNYFSVPNHNYISIYPQITSLVQTDIDTLDIFNIDYETNVFNEALFIPTKELCLSSRISRHDCLITASMVFPNTGVVHDNVILWTNDEQFRKGFEECNEVPNIFQDSELTIEFIRALIVPHEGKDKQLDLINESRGEVINLLLKEKVKQYIIRKSIDSFVGFTDYAAKVPDVIFIDNRKPTIIKERPILTIIGKNLDFIVTSNYIEGFQGNGSLITNYPIDILDVISCKWTFPNSVTQADRDLIMEELKKPGHLVFVDGYYEEF